MLHLLIFGEIKAQTKTALYSAAITVGYMGRMWIKIKKHKQEVRAHHDFFFYFLPGCIRSRFVLLLPPSATTLSCCFSLQADRKNIPSFHVFLKGLGNLYIWGLRTGISQRTVSNYYFNIDLCKCFFAVHIVRNSYIYINSTFSISTKKRSRKSPSSVTMTTVKRRRACLRKEKNEENGGETGA